jgi:hypothetical protein
MATTDTSEAVRFRAMTILEQRSEEKARRNKSSVSLTQMCKRFRVLCLSPDGDAT